MADAVARRERQALMDRAAAVVQQEAKDEERRRRKAKEQAAAYAAYINGLRVSEGGSAYSIGKQIGVGAYGAVHKAVHRATGTYAAYKIVDTYSGIPGQTMRELAALKTLVHENIVTLQNVEHIRGYGIGAPYKLAMALDLARCDLSQYIKQGGETRVAVGVDKARIIMYQLLSAIEHGHSRSFIHRDLKPANLLIGSDGKLKVADFGLAIPKYIPHSKEDMEVVTANYRPPELALEIETYSFAVDVWSIGCIFWEIVAGEVMIAMIDDDNDKLIEGTMSRLGPLLDWEAASKGARFKPQYMDATMYPVTNPLDPAKFSAYPPGVYDLFRSMVTYDPASRITCKHALEHPWFAGFAPVPL